MKRKLNLQIPNGITESELIAAIEEVAPRYCKKYSFPGHTEEDMMQIALIEGIDRAHKWDGERPIKNFLAVVIDRRLYNYKRDNYIRLESPCKKCPLKAYIKPNKCSLHEDRMDCKLFADWQDRNKERQNINNALDFGVIQDVNENSMRQIFDFDESLDKRELLDYIDQNLDIEYRKDYLILMAGGRLSSQKIAIVTEHVLEICKRKLEN